MKAEDFRLRSLIFKALKAEKFIMLCPIIVH